MTIQGLKSILIGVSPEQDHAPRTVAFGLSMARAAGAHASITAISPEMTLTHAFVSSVAAGLVAAENRRLLEQAQTVSESSRQDAMSQGISCTAEVIQDNYATLSQLVTKRARTHDITVLGAEPDALSLRRGILEETLFNSGRPIVIAPPNMENFECRTVIVAWDGSAKATRAVNDALPLLKSAERVEILSILGEKDISRSVPGVELAPHLTRHGVKCAVKDLAATDGDAAGTILSHSLMLRADLIVMGAYVHSRLRQLVLGGVTQAMLRDCPVPLLLSY